MQVAVIGASDCSIEEYTSALTLGRLIAGMGSTLVCGGMGGKGGRRVTSRDRAGHR